VAGRLFFATALPSLLLLAGLGVAAWSGARSAVMESLDAQLRTSVSIGAARLSASRARFLLPGDETSRTYQRLQKKLRAIKTASGSERVLLLDDKRQVLADADGNLAIGTPAPRLALDKTEFDRAAAGSPTVSVPFSAPDGRRFLSAYAKLPDDDAEATPLVLAMEAPTETLDLVEEVAIYVSLAVLVGMLLVVVASFVVAGTITRPLRDLAKFSKDLGAGALTTPLPPPTGKDEVAELGRTLEAMRRGLVERDQERQLMLAGIAHEVRNPLGGMELFSGLLEEGLEEAADTWPDDEARTELLEHSGRVRRELRYLKGVVNDFLAFARDLPLKRSDIDVVALLHEVQDLANTSGSTVRVDVVVEDGVRYPMDKRRIKEALLNLAVNAQQASPDGSVVTLSAVVDDDGRLVLDVKDQGKGMDAATQARVFSPFFTTRERGSGLGLPLVRKFARDHGGDAVIESVVGEGTCVRLLLARTSGISAARAAAEEDGRLPQRRKDTVDEEPAFLDDEPALLGDGPETTSSGDDDEPLLLGDG